MVLKEQVESLVQEKEDLQSRINKVRSTLASLQELCTHNLPDGKDAYENVGHDSHKDHYECSICKQMTYV